MTGQIIQHNSFIRLAASALFILLLSAAAFAQGGAPPPKANLMIERNAVRFEMQGAARSWQLDIFDKAGDLVFASGVVNNATLEWRLQDEQGAPFASGLYAYTLRFWDENNGPLATQRGHVIIDRAAASDRIWVTSDNAIGVGAESGELTVAGLPDSTIGGVKLAEASLVANERPQVEAAPASSGSTERQQLEAGALNAIGAIFGDGTAGRIAKFTGANTIDDSVMTEAGGNIQIGTNTNVARLTVAHTNDRGIFAQSDTAVGVYAQSVSSKGVYGYSANDAGVEGFSPNGLGVIGAANRNHGVYGTTVSPNFAGVFGVSNNGRGVLGESNNGIGVHGASQTAPGVRGQSVSGEGVYGYSNSGRGVFGVSTGHHGVHGRSESRAHAGVYGYNINIEGVGVLGEAPGGSNQTSIGVYGLASGWGVVGVGEAGHGVAGWGGLGASIYGAAGAVWAGLFDGNVDVTGNLSKGGGSFKIDHPLDPANKYLYHSFVESPDMMNIYNGVVTTGANGEAIVTLPDYFEALNRDFRYQLTVIGQFAQAIVASKIEGNSFTIKTDKPNVEVSWQVTGVRQDAFANKHRIPVEEAKPEKERGHYLHPAVFNQPEEKGVEWARHPETMKRMKAEREQRSLERTKKP
jgi:hypothetical protein